MLVIADTSPLHYLVLIEHTAILPALFSHVIIPPVVAEELQRPRTPALSAVGFLRVVIMPMYLPACMSLSLLPPEASSGLGQRQPRQGWARLLRHRDRRPGFGDEAALGQRRLLEQRHQDQVPAPAKETHQPQACGTRHPRLPRDQGGDVGHRAGRDRLLRLAP